MEAAIQHIFPLVFEFRKQRSPEELLHLRQKQRQLVGVDPADLEEMIINENKVAADNNIFVNTQAAHVKPETQPVASALATSSINSVQRLKQYESYVQMVQQTQEERRHIPFQGDNNATSGTGKSATTTTTAGTAAAGSSSSSSSTGDNICANARRRATECWATKLQNKRTRYNNIVNPESATSSSGNAHTRNPLKAAALATAKSRSSGTSGKIPVSQVLKQSSSRARNAQLHQHQQMQMQRPKLKHAPTYSPTDFEIDDLIEEEESNEYGLPY